MVAVVGVTVMEVTVGPVGVGEGVGVLPPPPHAVTHMPRHACANNAE
jgi:hypothetical protein